MALVSGREVRTWMEVIGVFFLRKGGGWQLFRVGDGKVREEGSWCFLWVRDEDVLEEGDWWLL